MTLSAAIPAEVSDAHVELSGTTNSNAALYITLSDGDSAGEVVSVASADADGYFSIFFDLPAEGSYSITLTAEKDGYADAQHSADCRLRRLTAARIHRCMA